MRQSKPPSSLFNILNNKQHQPLDFHGVLQILAEREAQRLHFRALSMNKVSGNNQPSGSPHKFPINKITHPFGQRVSSAEQDSTTNALVDHYSISIGCHPANAEYNRYMDIQPYDRTRVTTSSASTVEGAGRATGDGMGAGRYLNASWVLEYFGHKWWIAAQAPLPGTAHAFLSLVWEGCVTPSPQMSAAPTPHESGSKTFPSAPMELSRTPSLSRHRSRPRTIVQLTRNIEGGRRKAHEYFPNVVGQSAILYPESSIGDESNVYFPRSYEPEGNGRSPGDPAPLKVTLLSQKELPEAQCVWSTLTVVALGGHSDGNEPVRFHHLLYHAWPDHGVPSPEDKDSLVEFLKFVDRVNRGRPGETDGAGHGERDLDNDPDPPIIINCSAGIGRTGSFIALSSLLRSRPSHSLGKGVLAAAHSPTPSSYIPDSPLGALPGGQGTVSIKEEVAHRILQEIDFMREQRPGMVQRDEQVRLVWDVVVGTL